ncbi:MAG: alginate lyase family protein [Spirochaetota bacterium]|nr:alginate lyase family protein [Spirochaetota bacterium]
MNILDKLFINAPRKIFRIIFYRWEYFYYLFLYSRPKLEILPIQKRYLIYGGDDLNEVSENYRKSFPDRVKTKIAEADLICEHIFDLLGSGPVKLSLEGEDYKPINWHIDFKSNYSWSPKIFFRNIRFGHKMGVDVKVPWELSRFQHLNTLGQAYVLTKDRKYVDEFKNQITDWIKHNPIGFGVNWRCTMDIAIRAVNWLVSMEYFISKGILEKDFLNKFYLSIYEHGKFIRNHLEYYSEFTGNHYLSDIVGLFFITVYCPFFKESKLWQEFAIGELCKEIEKQVYPDGCNFEASTTYHRLVLELYFYSELLAVRAGIESPAEYQVRLKKMFEFSLYCLKPNGTIPQIGDNDSGRFLIFCRRPVLEHKYLLTLASIFYRDLEYKLSDFVEFDEEAFWVFGMTGKELYDSIAFTNTPLITKAFHNSGWYIIRHNNDYCFISCGANGQNGIGGHAHNDKLSFELVINGRDVIVDPGTYVYTPFPKERNKFRSTEYHNTIKFDGYEQGELLERDLFYLADGVTINNIQFEEMSDRSIFTGEIKYSDVVHNRTIILYKQSGDCLIKDSILSKKSITATLLFHLSPDLFYDKNYIYTKINNEKIISIETKEHKFEKKEYDYSPEYGLKIKAEYLAVNLQIIEKTHSFHTYIRKIM